MAYFLDTDHCIYALKGTYPAIGERLAEQRPQDIRIAAIVQAELLLGAEKSQRRRRTLEAVEAFLAPFAIVPFDEAAARAYAAIRAKLEHKGAPIGPNDLILAATVLAAGGVIVTHNLREFRRVTGLPVEDWTR